MGNHKPLFKTAQAYPALINVSGRVEVLEEIRQSVMANRFQFLIQGFFNCGMFDDGFNHPIGIGQPVQMVVDIACGDQTGIVFMHKRRGFGFQQFLRRQFQR